MKAIETKLNGCFVLEPTVFKDPRGYFFESFNQNKFSELIGQEIKFVQDNESFSSKGVLRGLHFQTGDYAQAKLVRVVKGTVLDVVVDMRKESSTFSKHFSIELSSNAKGIILGLTIGKATNNQDVTIGARCFFRPELKTHNS